MNRKMKREFVCVLTDVDDPKCVLDIIRGNSIGDGFSVTEYDGTITITCQTINGLVHIASVCCVSNGETNIHSAIRQIADEIVKFIG